MTLTWGAYVHASPNYGMRVGIDITFTAVTHTSKTCTATYKIYTQNDGRWDPPDLQQFEFDGNYSLPEIHEFENVGDAANDGKVIHRTTRTYTWTYTATSYGTSSLPQEADLVVDVIHTRPLYYPHHEVHVLFPIRPYAAPAPPTSIAAARTSDVSTKVTWANVATVGEPYDAVWLERYVYNFSTWARIATLAKTAVTHQDTTTVANRKYSYRVQADNSVGTSAYNQLTAPFYTTPAAPTAPVRTAGVGSQVLTWALDVGYTEYETEIWRSVDGVWSLLATVASGVTTYTDTTAQANQKTKYRFRTKTTANATVLYSADSAETTETTGVPTAPAAPTNLKPVGGTINPTGPVVLTWTHNPTDASAQTFFEVQYRNVGDVSWKTSGKTAGSAGTWTLPPNSVSKGKYVEWQVRTWGFSSTLPGPYAAAVQWNTPPLIPVKWPLFLDLDTGRTEADSKITTITEQTRRVATVKRETSTTNATAIYNILSYTLPQEMARAGKKFRITGHCNFIPDTAGMYNDLRIYVGVGALTSGTQLQAAYVDERIAGRETAHSIVCEWTFNAAEAGGENISTINIALAGFPGGGGSYVRQVPGRAAYLIIDEIIEGPSTASGGVAANSATIITAGAGLAGGGDLSSSRVIDLVAADNTLKVNADSVQVNTAVMATRAYADNAGGGTGGGGQNEVSIDLVEPVPVASHPEIWIDTSDDYGELRQWTSGTWGVAPLDTATYGPDTLRGQEIYLDAVGQLRARPQIIAGTRNVTDSPATYPAGMSIMALSATDGVALGWGFSCTVVTIRRSAGDTVVAQYLYQNHTPQSSAPVVLYRSGNGANNPMWSVWVSAVQPYDTGWIAVEGGVGFDPDWINYPSGYSKAAYRKIGTNVRARGLVRVVPGATGASGIFTLPVGFRPLSAEIFDASVNMNVVTGAASTGTAHTHTAVYNLAARLDVTTGGVVQAVPNAVGSLPANAYLSLNEIDFYTD